MKKEKKLNGSPFSLTLDDLEEAEVGLLRKKCLLISNKLVKVLTFF